MKIYKAFQLAHQYYQAGDLNQASNIYKKILRVNPNNIDALHFLEIICCQLGDFDDAIRYIRKEIELTPSNADVYYKLGTILQAKGLFSEGIDYFRKAISLKSHFPDAYYNLGLALQNTGQLDEAILNYQKAIQIEPGLVEAYNNLGILLSGKGQLEEAITYFQKAMQINPNYADIYNNLGLSLKAKGNIDDALVNYQKAINLNPAFADAYINLSAAFMQKDEPEKAIMCFKDAIQKNPNFAGAYNNLGSIYRDKFELDKAMSCFEKALQINPNLACAYYNLGTVLARRDKHDEAISCYEKALEINPDLAEAYSQLTHQMQQICRWQECEASKAKLDRLTRKALDTGTKPDETPFMSIIRHTDLSINFAVAKSWSGDIASAMSDLNINFLFDVRRTSKTKIAIGYLSNDFRNHATAHLMLSLFGLHSRDEFEIFCYSYGKDDSSYYRARIQHDCDKFVDVSSLSYHDAARCIYKDQVDILVDLKGYTSGNKLAICALRPAPIQVSYLGFPGTTGADFIDYIITDKIVTPEDHRPYYSENFVYMPHCYQVNDYAQPMSNKHWEKVDFGLPEGCFVFCSYNQPYKIDPVMFGVWMRILQQVPESVLWLPFGNKIVEENLKREAETRDVKSERLISAEMLPKDEHLSRLRFADLSLDTRICNGHTTSSDALWAGIPLITLQGSHFASRVSSSILSAMGLSELITYSLEDYEALAVRLAHNPIELQGIRQKIADNRKVAPLFDTPRFVRNLERAYKEMWKIFSAGEAPQQIDVLES